MVEKIGLVSVFDTKDFQKGLDIYLKGLKQADQATSKTSGSTTEAGSGVTAMGGQMGAAAGGIGLFTAAALGAAAAVGIALVNAITDAAASLINFQKEAILTAARVNELTIVAQLLGQRAGFTEQRITDETEAIKQFGIRTDVALKLMIQFNRYNLDLAKASELARVAQDAAVISMQDSSDALDNILYGILTYNKRILRTAGLNVDLRGAMKAYADELGKTSNELTEVEKVTASLNAVIAEGVRIAGVYEAAMETPGKQLRSLKRDMFDLSSAMGQPFQNAFAIVIKAARELTQSLTAALSPPKELGKHLKGAEEAGGELYDMMVNLGAAASIMADGIRWAAETLVNWLIGGLDSMYDTMESTGKNAVGWGINIMVQFADGLIQGAVSALTWAMNQITAMLTYWLSGQSPPRVAPDLPQWGMNAMTEFLKGFTEADFSALKAIQQPLQKALSILVQTGKLGKAAGGRMLTSISTELAKALSGGSIDPKFFEKMARSLGPFGAEIADLTKKVLELGVAEEKLKEAQKREQDALRKVRSGIEDYNRALRAGATEEQLDGRLELINAQEAQVQAAREEKSALEEQMDAMKEAVSLQQQLVDQLLMLTSAQIEMPDLAKAGAGAAGGLTGALSDALSNIDLSGFTTKWSGAVEEAKNKLLSLFDPIKDKWEQDWEPLFTSFAREWDLFEIKVWTVWYRLFGPERGILTKLLADLDFEPLKKSLEGLGDSFGNLVSAFLELFGIDTSGTEGALDAIAKWASDPVTINKFQTAIEGLAGAIDWLAGAIDWLAEAVPKVTGFLQTGLPTAGDMSASEAGYRAMFMGGGDATVTGFESGAEIGEAYARGFESGLDEPEGGWFGNIITDIGNFFTELGKAPAEFKFMEDAIASEQKVEEGWRINLTTVIAQGILDFISGGMDPLAESFSEEGDTQKGIASLNTAIGTEGNLWQSIIAFKDTLLADLVKGMGEVVSAFDSVILKLGELQVAMDKIDWENLGAVLPGSLPPLAEGLRSVSSQLSTVVADLPKMTTMAAPSMATVPVAGGSSSKTINLSFSAAINNDMDMATFEDRVSRVVMGLLV